MPRIISLISGSVLAMTSLTAAIIFALPSHAERTAPPSPRIFYATHSISLIGEPTKITNPASDETPSWTLFTKTASRPQEKMIDEPIAEAALTVSNKLLTIDAATRALYISDNSPYAKQTIITKPILGIAVSKKSETIAYQKLNDDWSPGQFFDQSKGIHIRDLTSNKETQLTSRWEDFGAFFAPDDSRIYFYSPNKNGIASLWSIRPDGTDERIETNADIIDAQYAVPVPSESPTWSEDGTSFTFISDNERWEHLITKNGIIANRLQ